MRLADYFGRAFSSVSAAQFPWLKTFKESTVAKLVDVSFHFASILTIVLIRFKFVCYDNNKNVKFEYALW